MKIRLSSFIVHLSSFVLMLALCASSSAAGFSTVHPLSSGTVSITNTQKRSSWVPVALLFRFTDPTSGTITVERRTGATAFLLTVCPLSNNQHAVWVPEADIPFNENDSLNITSTITNGTVEIIRKGE
jgi:ABC-type transport system involved in Fe-S cluster assembly fused permease/ATPase subunit